MALLLGKPSCPEGLSRLQEVLGCMWRCGLGPHTLPQFRDCEDLQESLCLKPCVYHMPRKGLDP